MFFGFFCCLFFFFKSAADQNTLLLHILSNPYILNTKTNIKAVILSQVTLQGVMSPED